MNIEVLTTQKKLTKSAIKQFEVASWSELERTIKEEHNTQFFKVNDVFKFSIVIFEDYKGDWSYFPLHTYKLTQKGDDVYMNSSKHLFINNKNSAELFIENVDYVMAKMQKIII